MPHKATHVPSHAPTHAVVWLDFHQAKIFLIKAEDVEARRIGADTPHCQMTTRRRSGAADTTAA